MATCVIANVEVIDSPDTRNTVHGGRHLDRSGATEVLEGNWSPQRCVIVEFPDMARFSAG